MRFRARQNGPAVAARGVARAAVAGIARHELIREAIYFLLASAKADRIGVWMESAGQQHVPGRGFVEFRGIVADRDGEATPPEWERLSLEAPLPVELLNAGKSLEQDLGGARDQIILGALVEIKRAIWVPVATGGRLRGVLLAGSHKKRGALPAPFTGVGVGGTGAGGGAGRASRARSTAPGRHYRDQAISRRAVELRRE